MSVTIKTVKDKLETFRTNPNAIQRYSLELLEEISNDSYIVSDPSNPFIFLLEMAAITASSSMDESRSRARELYPPLASKPEDIYRHMSDVDYLNQFSVPGKIIMSLILSVDDISNLAVAVENQSYRKLTIPKDTIFTISDINFGIYYPIDLIITVDEELRIIINTSTTSPIKTISDDKIDFKYFTYKGNQYINMDIAMEQFTLTTHRSPLNVNAGFNQTYIFTNLYYYCRVYTKINNVWVEFLTTHSKEVFDYASPTAQLTVLENQITVVIPQIYISRNVTSNEIRVDIYTTRGDINTNLGNFTQENSRYQWRDLDSDNKNIYSAPLGKLNNIAMYSASIITGGRAGESFLEIRDRVVKSRARRNVPIRDSELEVYLLDQGYDIIKSVDNITSRTYLATKKLPTLTDSNLIIQGTVFNVAIYEGDLERNNVNKHSASYTILPETLFKQTGNTVNIATEEEEKYIQGLDPTDLTIYLSNNNIFYNPFHYIISYSESHLTNSAYLLTEPNITSRQKLIENTEHGYQISSDKLNIEYTKDGYILKVSTISNQAVKDLKDEEVRCQISFIPNNDINRVFKNGEIIGQDNNERVFKFNLDSVFDIDRNDAMALSGFSRSVGENFNYRVSLNEDFILTFLIDSSRLDIERDESSLNTVYLGLHLLSDDAVGLTVESLTMLLGEPLSLLLTGSRMSVSGYEYETYKTDIPATYKENIYQRDDDGFMVLKEDPNTGEKYPVVLHYTGDKILDDDGNTVIEHKEDSIKLDNDNNPIILRERGRLFFLDVLLLNSMYQFVTLQEQRIICNTIPKMINDIFKNELEEISDKLLERTELFYLPKKTIGKINIQISKNRIIEINSEQRITVSFYVTEITNRDTRLKERYENVTDNEIVNWLNDSTLSISNLIGSIIDALGDGILGVKIGWTDELEEYDTFVITDPGDSISIKQILTLNYDNTLEIKNAITYVYIEQGL